MEAKEGTFEWCLIQLKAGQVLSRRGWKNMKWTIKADLASGEAGDWQFFIFMNHTAGVVPWAPQQFDLSGTDYYLFDGEFK